MSAPLRVGIYARVPEADFTAADAIIARLRTFLEPRMPGGRPVCFDSYPEVAEPGLGRMGPVLERLLADARAGRLDLVLVEDLRALSLLPRRQTELVLELAAASVQVVPEEFVRAWPVTGGGAAQQNAAEVPQ
jgi:hypothetical protein